MLNNSFYQVTNTQIVDGGIALTVQFNEQHPVFEGHFPGQPVVPGVCILQIIKEQLALHLNQPLVLREAAQVKYLSVVTPQQAPEVTFTLLYTIQEQQRVALTATVTDNTVTYCKARLMFSNAL